MKFYWHPLLMKPIKGRLPQAVVDAAEAYGKVREAFGKVAKAFDKAPGAYLPAWGAREKARKAFDKTLANHHTEIEALHAKECPKCPRGGEIIFP